MPQKSKREKKTQVSISKSNDQFYIKDFLVMVLFIAAYILFELKGVALVISVMGASVAGTLWWMKLNKIENQVHYRMERTKISADEYSNLKKDGVHDVPY